MKVRSNGKAKWVHTQKRTMSGDANRRWKTNDTSGLVYGRFDAGS